jgi:ribose transport system permease protein
MGDIARAVQQRRRLLNSNATQRLLAFASLIGLIVVFSLASPNFFKFENLVAILIATAVTGILAVAVTFVIITAGIDLSVGTLMTFCAVIAGVLVTMWHLPVLVGVLGAILMGGLVGLLSGTFISRLKIPPFIATLGMMYVAKGLSLIISGLKPVYFNDTPSFALIAMGSVTGAIIPGFNIPNAVIIFFAVALLSGFLLNRTILGRYTFAMGSNEEAVRLSGVNVDRWKTVVYTVCGLICGVAGVVIAARLNSAQPALGQGYELDAIAAAVIGGTSLSGGEGTILGTVIGAFVMSVLTNGLRILSVPQEWQTVMTGVIVIFAVYADILRRRRA